MGFDAFLVSSVDALPQDDGVLTAVGRGRLMSGRYSRHPFGAHRQVPEPGNIIPDLKALDDSEGLLTPLLKKHALNGTNN